MRLTTLVVIASLTAPAAAAAQQTILPAVVLRSGLVITRSVRVVARTYRLSAPASLDSALVTIRGDNIRVDFGGARLIGASEDGESDRGAGVAVKVEGGRNVTITGLNARGYKVAVLARGTQSLTIQNSDLSYNWKPRLYSLVEHESLTDWLSYHRNEHREWLRFGAGIYLDGVSGGAVTANTVVQGMNGLLMNRTDHVRVEGNNFSFNSGLGIGLYRSSDNIVAYNTVEYDVRGYSHRVYRRGQDSAGILMYEQSCRNIVAWNSVTHGGDGLFIWAGQTTMDSGQGGVNDNLIYGNDFSWAPTNGMEATFSRNTFAANLIEGSDHGLWGGYSYSSRVVGNRFVRNRVGIAIEHGQDNVIAANTFDGDTTAIYLWANAIEPSDWGYPKFRDTRGRDYQVDRNLLRGNRTGIRAFNHLNLAMTGNQHMSVDSFVVLRDTVRYHAEGNGPAARPDAVPALPAEYAALAPDSIGGPRAAPLSPLARRDRSTIIVDEWGPYDWKSPKLWPLDSTRAVPLRLAVLGPPGRWRLVSRRGIETLSANAGRTGDTVTVTPAAGSAADWELVLEYRGAATVSPRGQRRGAGVPVRFAWARLEPRTDWTVRFFAWTDSTSPQTRPDQFAELLRSTPLLARNEPRLDYMWYAPPRAMGLPQAKLAIEATTTVELAPGEWTLRSISDDAVRIWVDGVLLIDNWTPHESAVDNVLINGGAHQLRVQHYQAAGWTELRVDFVRGRQRSAGSPGPH